MGVKYAAVVFRAGTVGLLEKYLQLLCIENLKLC
jgi:hypothetical protein